MSHFREAIRIDPKYAVAYAAIANEKIVQGLFSTASKNEIVNEVRTALEAAKALDPDLADIYTSEGALKFYYDWDWEGAINSYKKALELDPGNATIYIRYSTTLADLGRYKEALPWPTKQLNWTQYPFPACTIWDGLTCWPAIIKKYEAFGKAWSCIRLGLGPY